MRPQLPYSYKREQSEGPTRFSRHVGVPSAASVGFWHTVFAWDCPPRVWAGTADGGLEDSSPSFRPGAGGRNERKCGRSESPKARPRDSSLRPLLVIAKVVIR